MLRGVRTKYKFLGSVGKQCVGITRVNRQSPQVRHGQDIVRGVHSRCGIYGPLRLDVRCMSRLAMDKAEIQTKALKNYSRPSWLNNVPVNGTMYKTTRRFYTPRSVVEQIVDTYPDEQFETRPLLSRKLGGIENMYNMFASDGTDIVCLCATVESVYKIIPQDAEKAWTLLLKRHPLLRMRIVEDNTSGTRSLHFVENDPIEYDFKVAETGTNWVQYMLEELKTPFHANARSLIRFRIVPTEPTKTDTSIVPTLNLKSRSYHVSDSSTSSSSFNDTFQYKTTLIFIMHHSIMDGGYSMRMLQEFLNLLDAVVHEDDLRVQELPLLPPMEEYFQETLETLEAQAHTETVYKDDGNTSDSTLTFCHDSVDDTVLKQYNKTFKNDIRTTENQILSNGCLLFKYTKSDSRTLMQTCKSNGCSPKGAFTTAAILALLELVYNTDIEKACNGVSFPLEYMFDFRRCDNVKIQGDDVSQYPGVAALHIPLVAKLNFTNGKITKESFWSLARHFGNRVDECINSPEVYSWIQSEAAKYNNHPNQDPGKSPYVLSISNMGRLDGVLNEDISKRVKLTDLHGHSSIMIDQMPLFFFTIFSLNGHVCGNVSYCQNYTSDATAAQYVGLIRKYMFSYSNL